MAQSLSQILLHVIFSTKERRPFLSSTIRPQVHAYLAATARQLGAECYRAGGIEDHVHLAVRLPRTLSVSKLVEQVKSSSSKWIKTLGPTWETFAWQAGYGAFSISRTHLSQLVDYIGGQEEHHRKMSFQDEYRALLRKLRVDFDERYVWD
ncbi:IS200/IS605 family transposase [Haloferula sargassicola]|uniref:Transposase IS200-like domain-containing protein n=1 Tax=Haloferula sargassicola TaxID=490096 RepID=A0ABP9UJK1_9BACT